LPLLEDRSIFHLADDYEAVTQTSTEVATLPVGQQRTLHEIDDEDWLRVELKANQGYQFFIDNQLSGADVKLAVYHDDGITPVTSVTVYGPGSNGQEVVYTTSTDFKPTFDGAFRVHAKRNTTSPAFVRYGSYQLHVR